MADDCWRIALFGGLSATQGTRTHRHFETRKTGALLACLALFPQRSQPREVLAEQLWPDEAPDATRNRFRQALSTLRRLLETPDATGSRVLLATRGEVRLNPTAITSDVADFEAALCTAAQSIEVTERVQSLREAVELYEGELLPGYYEEWITAERERLAIAYQNALGRLAAALIETGDYSEAIVFARRAIAGDPLQEEAYCNLIRMHMETGHTAEALRQYKELERVLRDALGVGPSSATRQLLSQLHASSAVPVAGASPLNPAVRSVSAAMRANLEAEGGAVPLNSPFYITRPTDEQFEDAIARQDSIVLVKGARQIGKTSLLARGLQQARESGAGVVLTDLQKLAPEQMVTAETLFRTFAEMIVDQLDLDLTIDVLWNPRRGWNVNFERFLRREVLNTLASPLVWGLDEVDRLFGQPYSEVVFGLFRSWHNERSLNPDGPWRNLTLAIAYATEAHLFITDLNQSPFNVGTRLTLEDFTQGEVARLNQCYNSPLHNSAELTLFHSLVGGHPYLVRCGLHRMREDGLKITALEAEADHQDGIFGDHLRRMLASLMHDAEMCDAMRAVLKGQGCPTLESFYRLCSAGVVVGKSARDAKPRCGLYRAYLTGRLL